MPKTENKKNNITILQAVVSGSVAGVFKNIVNYPFTSLYNMIRSGEKFTLNPKILYQGIYKNLITMVPITAVQVGLNRTIQKYMLQDAENVKDAERVGIAIAAGVGAAPVSSVTGLILSQQSTTTPRLHRFFDINKTMTFSETTFHLYETGGLKYFSTGLFATMLRDGIFAGAAFGAGPVLKQHFNESGSSDSIAALKAGFVTGSVATIATQGVEIIKNDQQSADPRQTKGFLSAAYEIKANQGTRGFFKGILSRGGRVVSAVTVIGKVKEKMDAVFQELNTRKKYNP